MAKKILLGIFLILLLGGTYLLLSQATPQTEKQKSAFQAKRTQSASSHSGKSPASADPLSHSETPQPRDDDPITTLLQRTAEESFSYASKEGWVEDKLYFNPGQEFEQVVVHSVFAEKDAKTPLFTSRHLADQIVLSLEKDLSDDELSAMEQSYGVKLLRKLSLPATYQFQLVDVSLKNLVATRENLEKHPGVRASEYNGLEDPSLLPDDPYFKNGLLWGLQNQGKLKGQDGSSFQKDLDLAVTKTWERITDCTNTPVAVIDTGIDFNHPDLAAQVDIQESRNFVGNDPKAIMDENKHGTHVSGTIGAIGNNGIGTTGICWKAKILAIRVLGPSGGTNVAIAEGMMHFVKSSAKVANMSLGSKSAPSRIYIDAVREVEKAGKLIIASAGNDNLNVDTTNRPIGNIESDNIIVVAAIDGNGKKASFSNYGVKNVDIAAPGVQIWSTVPKMNQADYSKAYAALQGTSMATPHVTGAVALLWSYFPSLDAVTVRKIFLDLASRKENLKTLASEGRVLQLGNILEAIEPKGKIAETLKQIELKQTSDFELPIQLDESFVKIKSVEILNGETSLGMADMVGDKIKISVPTLTNDVMVRLRITDADGHVTVTDPIALKTERSKAAVFDQLDLEAFQGDVNCQLKEEKAEAEPSILFERKLVSREFCQKICRMIRPMVHSTQATITCGDVP